MACSAEIEGPPHRAEPAWPSDVARAKHEREALEVGLALHHLALRYWLEERLEDAVRVGSQAAAVLEGLRTTEVVEEVLARLRELELPEERAPK
jgi:hypothetical protein